MSSLAMSEFVSDWVPRVEDDGVMTVSTDNKSFVASAGANAGRAYMRKFIPFTGGETIIFRFSARAISGVVQGAIDYPVEASFKAFVTVEGTDWKEYELRIAVPLTHKVSQYAQVSCGVYQTQTGEGEFANLRIEVEDNARGPMNCWASGLFRFRQEASDPAIVEINENFHTNGITSVAWDGVDGTLLKVTIPPTYSGVNRFVRPIFFAQLTSEYFPQLMAKVGEYDVNTGEVTVKFSNGANSFIDIRDILVQDQSMFMSFMAVGI